MLQVSGILETAVYVSSLTEAAGFYRRLFGFDTLLESERLVALDVAGRDILLLFPEGGTGEPVTLPGGVIPPHGPRQGRSGSSHFAFSIASADVDGWKARLSSEGIAVESVVTWPQGATSIYFRDLDDHLLELMTPGFWRTY